MIGVLVSLCIVFYCVFVSLQKYLADILSVLALTMSAEGERVSLLFYGIFLIKTW